MKDFKYNKFLILFIFVGLVAAMAINMQRYQVEQQNATVDLAVDYEDLVELAEIEGMPVKDVLAQAKEAGITSLAVYDRTFKKLNVSGKTIAVNGSQLLESYQNGSMTDPAWRALVENGTIQGTKIYVTGRDELTFRETKEDLIMRLGEDRVRSIQVGGSEALEVLANYKAFEKMDLGMPTDEMKAVNDAGFYVLARPTNYQNCTDEQVKHVFSRLEGVKISEVVFSGSQVLGANKALDTTIKEMNDRDLTLGLIEGTTQLQFYQQDGLMDLATGLDYRTARLYAVPKAEQPKLKLADIVERWANTDQERNIRIDLLKTYDKPSPNMTLLETNMKYFKDTHDILVEKGFKTGPADTFPMFMPSKVLRALVMMGVAAAVVLYLSLIVPALNRRAKLQFIIFAVFAACAAVPVLMGSGSKIRLAASLASANIFPALAVIWQLDRIRNITAGGKASLIKMICTGAVALFVCGAMSYVGAAYLSGSLADTRYLLEIDIFRGIKLTFVLPILLVAIAFLQRFDVFDGKMDDTEGVMEQLKRILDMPVRIKTLLLLFLALVAAVVFVARSGHTSGMPVSGLELKFRAFLERAFYARPRSKELLIGHPAFMLAAMAWWKKWPTMVLFLLVIVATIGQGSMVETFAHMRTPVFMSFMRGIGGILLGAGVGAIAMVAIHLWQTVIALAKERNSQHE